MDSQPTGRVYLIGGGPGDPGLLTLRGAECLARADVVLYDYLINPSILAHAPRAELICLGRHGLDRVLRQDEINAQLVAQARMGRTVARLKGGDPAVFGHLVEEVESLRAAGIRYEIVPGVTAALAAAAYAGLPLTQRDAASAVAFVTGNEGPDKQGELDFASLAKFPGTLVFYMGVTTVRRWATALLTAGKPPATPTAIVVRASWPDQQVLRSDLGKLADEVERRRLRPPAVFVVGPVAASTGMLDWSGARPLSALTIVVTRPARQPDWLADRLAELGARVLRQPAIEISAPADWQPVDRAIGALADYHWLVFASINGVEAFLGRLLAIGHDLRSLGGLKLAAIGPGTAEVLTRHHLRADIVPVEFRSESLAGILCKQAEGRRFLLVRASRGRDLLSHELRRAGATVDEVVAYTSRDVTTPDAEIVRELRAGKVDWITVSSSAIARSIVSMFGADLAQAKLASISPVTSTELVELGQRATVEASEHTMPGLVSAICGWLADTKDSGQSQHGES